MAEDDELSSGSFRISFDGDALASHKMNVKDLAPSLMALGEVFVEANKIINGKDVNLELMVTPNVEERCFDIGLEIFQQWQSIRDLIGQKNVIEAKEIIDWILIKKEILSAGGAAGAGLIALYKMLKGKKPISIIHFNDENGNKLFRYQFKDEPDQILDEKMHLLYNNKKIKFHLGKFLKPLIHKQGIDEIIVYRDGKKIDANILTKREAQDIDFSNMEEVIVPDTKDGEPVEAILRAYSPVYDLKAPNWRFWLGDEHHYMDVTESNIVEIVLENGGALIDDRFKVLLQENEVEDSKGQKTQEFKILQVLDFIPAYRQRDLFSENAIKESGEDEPKPS